MNKMKGYSLVELLVVIAVIGVLATMVLVALGSARVGARDTKRVNDLKQLQVALDSYHLKKGSFPCKGLSLNDQLIDGNVTHCLESFLVPKYISNIPFDPIYGQDGSKTYGSDYQYISNTGVDNYLLRVNMEDSDSVIVDARYWGGSTCADDLALPIVGTWKTQNYRRSACDTVTYQLSSNVS